jgi:glutaredoxin
MRWSTWVIPLALLAVAAGPSGCAEERDDGTKPAVESLPELTLTDETPELLLTWIDDKGGTHSGVSLAEVPEGSKGMVRVVTREAGHGTSFYVADLSAKQADGSYPVRVVPRGEWEAELQKRRAAYRAKHAPPPRAPHPGDDSPPTADGQPSSGLQAIIYGASWCKPCHQAAAYLRSRGVDVVEHDIEKQPKYAAEMQRKLKRAGLGGGSIPIIDVGGVILQGFSTRALDRAVAQARKGGTHL